MQAIRSGTGSGPTKQALSDLGFRDFLQRISNLRIRPRQRRGELLALRDSAVKQLTEASAKDSPPQLPGKGDGEVWFKEALALRDDALDKLLAELEAATLGALGKFVGNIEGYSKQPLDAEGVFRARLNKGDLFGAGQLLSKLEGEGYAAAPHLRTELQDAELSHPKHLNQQLQRLSGALAGARAVGVLGEAEAAEIETGLVEQTKALESTMRLDRVGVSLNKLEHRLAERRKARTQEVLKEIDELRPKPNQADIDHSSVPRPAEQLSWVRREKPASHEFLPCDVRLSSDCRLRVHWPGSRSSNRSSDCRPPGRRGAGRCAFRRKDGSCQTPGPPGTPR